MPVVDPLDILEAQIVELEKKVIGDSQIGDKDEPIVESLVNSSNALNSAVGSYEAILSVFDRISELGTYLDPAYEDSAVDTIMKAKLVLDFEPEIRSMLVQMDKLNPANDVLSSDPYKDVLNLTDKLAQLSKRVIETTEDFQNVEIRTKRLSDDHCSAMTMFDRASQMLSASLLEIEEANRTVKTDENV